MTNVEVCGFLDEQKVFPSYKIHTKMTYTSEMPLITVVTAIFRYLASLWLAVRQIFLFFFFWQLFPKTSPYYCPPFIVTHHAHLNSTKKLRRVQ